ncbi:hypothetical protein AGABI1DRAFT_111380 [Agaricus bisporus var. burnettii JB137-S8]|uniref:Nucleolar protein 16 n=2 Tax=Agaricus bisporus var. burnettii TaxID=192524 RepID=K5X4N2_AGABU|nr:uncharacterized protein AGABI1DRAFT_111380 [Agaricus bisporus var. burnettii JB137-S8]EKM82811.1 hypothetical protein AGABI1DRAFT_111380 [Agaricus bisporus var. burnettii JB137-S8]KAF7778849.1 hypothetical protein Agabi119p4_3194 [Agaricus bisporus var. burnettii]
MANPRQRRKTRSSSYRPISVVKNSKRNMKKMPPVRGPKVLQDAWDKSKTTKQNYGNLGLIHSLNPLASGGSEHAVSFENNPSSSTDEVMKGPPVTFGRIIRNEAGEIVQLEMNEDHINTSTRQPTPPTDTDTLSKWTINGGTHEALGTVGAIVRGLECVSVPQTASNTLSFSLSGVGPRTPSAGEVLYLRRLVNKYGDDVERMSRDRRLNPEQRTIGQLRNALRRVDFNGSV